MRQPPPDAGGLFIADRRNPWKRKNEPKSSPNSFSSTLYLSAFTFGGGYVIVTLLKKKFVDQYHWIEENEMLDLVAIAQSAPAPLR